MNKESVKFQPQFTINELINLSSKSKIRNYRQSDTNNYDQCRSVHIAVTSPFSTIKSRPNFRNSQSCLIRQPMRKQCHSFLRKGQLNKLLLNKCESAQKMRKYYQLISKPNKMVSQHEQNSASKLKRLKFSKIAKKCCKPHCGLFKIKCCNCTPSKLDDWNFQFIQYLKNRGKWSSLWRKYHNRDGEIDQDQIKSTIVAKMVETYIKKILDKYELQYSADDYLNSQHHNMNSSTNQKQSNIRQINIDLLGNLKPQHGNTVTWQTPESYLQRNSQNFAIRGMEDVLNKASSKIMDELGLYIGSLDIDEVGKQNLIDWSTQVNQNFIKEINKHLEKRTGKLGIEEVQGLVLKARKNYDGQGYETKFAEGHKNSSNKFSKFKNLSRTDASNNIKQAKLQKINKKIAALRNKNGVRGSGDNQEAFQNGGMGLDAISSSNFLKSKSNKAIDKMMQKNKSPSQDSHSSMKTQKQLYDKIASIKVIKEKKDKKGGIRNSSLARNNNDFLFNTKNKQSLKNEKSQGSSNRIPTLHTIKTSSEHSKANQRNHKIPTIQPETIAADKKQSKFIDFPEEFQTLCGTYKVKEEIRRKRKRRLGVILKGLEINVERQQYNKFKKQIQRNKKLQSKLEKCLKQVNCQQMIMSNQEPTITHTRKAKLIDQIISKNRRTNKMSQKLADTLNFYVKIFRKNYGIKLRQQQKIDEQNENTHPPKPRARPPAAPDDLLYQQQLYRDLNKFVSQVKQQFMETASSNKFTAYKNSEDLKFYDLSEVEHEDWYQWLNGGDDIPNHKKNYKKGHNVSGLGDFVMERVYVSREDNLTYQRNKQMGEYYNAKLNMIKQRINQSQVSRDGSQKQRRVRQFIDQIGL